MADDEHVVAGGEALGGAVGRAVVDDQHVAGMLGDFVEHRVDVRRFVVDGQGGEITQRLVGHGECLPGV